MSATGPIEAKASSKQYLVEVQGLRTIAALLVAIYHIWFGRVSGGVDIFFVVAAFFMTRSLLKTDRVTIPAVRDYYLSTFRRILPGATLVVIFTIIGVLLVMPAIGWKDEIRNAAATVLFLENWHLARSGADYLNQGARSSAFQQFWALSMQGQFYVLFPLLILMADQVARVTGQPRLRVVLSLFCILFLGSFAYSVHRTAIDQPFTYFDSIARAWEFAAGAIAALVLHRLHPPRPLMVVLGFMALAALLTFARLIDVSRLFPGYVALVPVIIALTIILASQARANLPLLTWKPVVQAGDYSFAFYLWHWPLLTFCRVLNKSDEVDIPTGLGIILAAAVLAYLSTRFVETPFRRSAWLARRPFVAAAACCALAAAPLPLMVGWYVNLKRTIRAAEQDIAAYIAKGKAPTVSDLVPAPLVVRDDLPPGYADGCHQGRSAELRVCTYGDPAGMKTIVLVGGSHSAQWLPALQEIARRRSYKILSMTKSACAFRMGSDGNAEQEDPTCITWNEAAMAAIRKQKPDLVFTISTRAVKGREGVPGSYRRAWSALNEDGIPILALRDNPWFRNDVPYCVSLNEDEPSRCAMKRSLYYAASDPAREGAPSNLHIVDFSDDYCDARADLCPAVKGHVLMYRDAHHLTRTYIMSFVPRLDAALAGLLSPRS